MDEQQALAQARDWVQNSYFDAEARKELQDLIDKQDIKEIIDRFYRDLEFGTGGLRSIMGLGPNRMSRYTVRKATQALAVVLKKQFSQLQTIKVALSFDSRRNSDFFAKEAACVLAAHGIHAYIYKRLNPTPLLSFAVRYVGAQAGIMVTASHNPPSYNGYKAFWNTGCQVIPPYDAMIIEAYNAISDFSSINYIEFNEAEKQGLIHWMGEEVEEAFLLQIEKFTFNKELCLKHGNELKIAYTPIHGSGLNPCTKALARHGFSNVHLVASQVAPDGTFPTVKSPNPEDPEALTLVVDLMKKEKADIAFGTDPDSDRLGVVVRQGDEVVYLNGNQVGVLLLHYMLFHYKKLGLVDANSVAIKSIVTSEMQTTIAEHFGVPMKNTLTGFKWMCGLYDQLVAQNPKCKMLFASEESYGYLCHDLIRDKDAVSALLIMSEMALWYKVHKKQTLVEALDSLYEQFGLYKEGLLSLNYLGKEGAEKIQRIMNHFRTYKGKDLAGYEISALDDYEALKHREWVSGEESLLDFPIPNNVLGFSLKNGDKLFLRPSGTEPKIKFYFLIQEKEGSLAQKHQAADKRIKEFSDFCHKISESL